MAAHSSARIWAAAIRVSSVSSGASPASWRSPLVRATSSCRAASSPSGASAFSRSVPRKVWSYRASMAAASARVTPPSGSMVVSPVPVRMPLGQAQPSTASRTSPSTPSISEKGPAGASSAAGLSPVSRAKW